MCCLCPLCFSLYLPTDDHCSWYKRCGRVLSDAFGEQKRHVKNDEKHVALALLFSFYATPQTLPRGPASWGRLFTVHIETVFFFFLWWLWSDNEAASWGHVRSLFLKLEAQMSSSTSHSFYSDDLFSEGSSADCRMKSLVSWQFLAWNRLNFSKTGTDWRVSEESYIFLAFLRLYSNPQMPQIFNSPKKRPTLSLLWSTFPQTTDTSEGDTSTKRGTSRSRAY